MLGSHWYLGLPGLLDRVEDHFRPGPTSCGRGRWGRDGAAGGVLVEGTGAPDVGAGAMDLGVIDGRDMVAVPDPTRGVRDQVSQGPGDAVLVPGAVLGKGFQGLPGGGLLQGQDRLGDGMFLDVERQGGDPLSEAVKPWRVKAQAKALSRACQMDQVSLASVMMRLLCRGQLGLGPPGRFRLGDAAFQYGTPAQLLWSFSWKLLVNQERPHYNYREVAFVVGAERCRGGKGSQKQQ